LLYVICSLHECCLTVTFPLTSSGYLEGGHVHCADYNNTWQLELLYSFIHVGTVRRFELSTLNEGVLNNSYVSWCPNQNSLCTQNRYRVYELHVNLMRERECVCLLVCCVCVCLCVMYVCVCVQVCV